MKDFFRLMAGNTGRWVRGVLGLAIAAWGYSSFSYPKGLVLILLGLIVMLLSMLNLLPLAFIAGLPVRGHDIVKRYKEKPMLPGEEDSPDGLKNEFH